MQHTHFQQCDHTPARNKNASCEKFKEWMIFRIPRKKPRDFFFHRVRQTQNSCCCCCCCSVFLSASLTCLSFPIYQMFIFFSWKRSRWREHFFFLLYVTWFFSIFERVFVHEKRFCRPKNRQWLQREWMLDENTYSV